MMNYSLQNVKYLLIIGNIVDERATYICLFHSAFAHFIEKATSTQIFIAERRLLLKVRRVKRGAELREKLFFFVYIGTYAYYYF
jgi:hypothetical protein